jgi:microcystin-dependent protein
MPDLLSGRKGKNKSGLFDPDLTNQGHIGEHEAAAQVGQTMPPGAIVMWGGRKADVPHGWLICHGDEVSRDEYSALYAAIGDTYGAGDGVDTFNVPDMQERMPLGVGATTALGSTGGSKDHTHANGSMGTTTNGDHAHNISNSSGSAGGHAHSSEAAHTHSSGSLVTSSSAADTESGNTGLTIASLDTHTHNISGSTASGGSHSHGSDGTHTHGSGTYSNSTNGDHSHSVTGSSAVSNPPYIGLNYIIKT